MTIRSNRDPLTIVDLFCGAGGLSGAFEQAGFHTVSAVDIERDCLSTIEATKAARIPIRGSARCYFDRTRVLNADIRSVRRADLVPESVPSDWRPDVLAGGPPCQPFSSAGSGLGLEDPRGQLFQHFARLAEELRPRIVLFENVAGLVTAKDLSGRPGGVLQLIQTRFEHAGYACRFSLLNSADFGAAQRRVRLYMVATADGALPNFPVATHSLSGDGGMLPWVSLQECLSRLDGPTNEDIIRPRGKRAEELQALAPGQGLKSGGIVEANRPSGHWGYRQDCFVADLTMASRTIRAASTPDWIKTPEGLRRLTWRECAALQGFDPAWVFMGGRAALYRQVGNAVQGQIGEAIAQQLTNALRDSTSAQPTSAPWPLSFDRRVRYTAMEERVNGDHRRAARDRTRTGGPEKTLCAAE